MLYFLTGLSALKVKFSHTKDTTKPFLFLQSSNKGWWGEDLALTFAHRQRSKQDFRCTDICNYPHGKKKSPYAALSPVSCLQKVLAHSGYMLLMNMGPFWPLQQDKSHLPQKTKKINVEEKCFKIITFQVVSVHIRAVFLRIVLILRTLFLLFRRWGLVLIKSPQISNTCS